MYEVEFDLSSVPTGSDFEVGFEVSAPDIQGRRDRRSRLTFPIVGPTDVATMWVLLPDGMPYRDVELVSYQKDRASLVEAVEPTYRFDMADGSLFGWIGGWLIEQSDLAGESIFELVIMATVLLSVFVHDNSAAPAINIYTK